MDCYRKKTQWNEYKKESQKTGETRMIIYSCPKLQYRTKYNKLSRHQQSTMMKKIKAINCTQDECNLAEEKRKLTTYILRLI